MGNGHAFFIGILTEQKHKGTSYWHFKLTSGCFTFSFYSFSCEMRFIDRIMPSVIMTIISLMPTMIKIPPGAPTPTRPDGWEAGKPRNRAIDSRSADAEVLLIIKTIVIVVILTIVIMINDYDNLKRRR